MKQAQGYFWVIGGGLLQVPLIEEVKKLGLKAIVTDRNPSCVCREKADLFFTSDIFDIPGHLNIAKKLQSDGVHIAAVLAAGIDATETMAVLAAELRLPGVNPEIARITNNKDLYRQRLKELGYPVPKFQVIDQSNLEQLPDIAKEIGFPLIIKNTSSSGSRGTRIFYVPDFKAMHEAALNAISVSRSKKALIEEFWEGEEQSVETLFDIHGNFHPCFITDRLFEKKDGYAIEIGLRNPSILSEAIQKEMFDLACRVAKDLGIKTGAAKFDMILTENGPRIIEMTTRLTGGFDCQYLVPAATGQNVLCAAALTALGQQFPKELLEKTKNKVGLTGSIWPNPGRIVAIEGLEDAKKVPGLEHVFFRYKVGDTIESYVDCTKRVCFIIVTGETESDARRALIEVKERIKIKVI